jgi:hypothetical protein
VQDLEALTDAQLQASPGDGGRKAIDFVYETIFVNQMISARIRGDDPTEWPWNDGWATAPADFAFTADAVEGIKASVEELKAAVDNTPEDKLLEIVTVGGNETSVYEGATFAAMHMMYHDAQLNYIQSMGGDMEIHWG